MKSCLGAGGTALFGVSLVLRSTSGNCGTEELGNKFSGVGAWELVEGAGAVEVTGTVEVAWMVAEWVAVAIVSLGCISLLVVLSAFIMAGFAAGFIIAMIMAGLIIL